MTYTPILRNALRYGALLALVIAVVGSIIGFLVAGVPGLVSALLGALLTMVFMGLTAASVLIAGRATRSNPQSLAFYGIIMGVWVLKFIVFIVVILSIRGQAFVAPYVFFVSMLVAVIGSLVVDCVAYVRSRVPYTDAVLPGSGTP